MQFRALTQAKLLEWLGIFWARRIDSGSSHSFISESLASKWRNWTALPSSMQVRVANGQTLSYTHELVDCPLWISGHGFKVSLKILPLNYYDIILGID